MALHSPPPAGYADRGRHGWGWGVSEYTPGAGARTLEPEAGMLVFGPTFAREPRDFGRVEFSGGPGGACSYLTTSLGRCMSPTVSPDLSDPATRYLALAQLARRVGLEPAWGVTWRQVNGGWECNGRGFYGYPQTHPGFTYVPGIDTDDAAAALDRALWATREVTP